MGEFNFDFLAEFLACNKLQNSTVRVQYVYMKDDLTGLRFGG